MIGGRSFSAACAAQEVPNARLKVSDGSAVCSIPIGHCGPRDDRVRRCLMQRGRFPVLLGSKNCPGFNLE